VTGRAEGSAVALAVEGCNGWRYVVEEIEAAGFEAQYGIGGLIAVAVWSELGDCRRFARSEQAVRHTGLDVTVDASDRRRAGGFLSRQGPQTRRWAPYEAAKNSSHLRSPDHAYYARVKARHDGKIAAISVARKLARRCYHVLRSVDPELVYATPG
jgi:transposase